MKTPIGIVLSAVLLAACSPGDNGSKPKMLVQQRAAMDKAKDVGNVLQQSAQQQQKDIDKQAQ